MTNRCCLDLQQNSPEELNIEISEENFHTEPEPEIICYHISLIIINVVIYVAPQLIVYFYWPSSRKMPPKERKKETCSANLSGLGEKRLGEKR